MEVTGTVQGRGGRGEEGEPVLLTTHTSTETVVQCSVGREVSSGILDTS